MASSSVTTGRGVSDLTAARKLPKRHSASERVRLPGFVAPQLATLVSSPPKGSEWVHEIKYDGYRAIAAVAGGRCRIFTRSGQDWTAKFESIAEPLRRLDVGSALLDGEIVALDDRGVPSFQRLQERMHVSLPDRALMARVPVAYFVFDVLHLDGESCLAKPWTERRAMLDGLGLRGTSWATPPAFEGEGDMTVAVAAERDLEGVVAKRLDSTYVPGQRSRAWVKIKRVARDEFIVAGFTPGEGRRAGSIGSLALGLPVEGGGLRYVGNVGTGFTDRELRRLESTLRPAVTDVNPFTDNVGHLKRGTVFVTPRLVTDIEYTERTSDGILRHPSYKGERIDKSPADVNTDRDISP